METRDPDTGQVRSLTDICREDDMPAEATVRRWRKEHPEFGVMYEAARQERTHMLADEIIEISDTETDAQRARNRIDARKWYTAEVNKASYGEAADRNPPLVLVGPDDQRTDVDLARRIGVVLQQMLARRQAKTIEAQLIEDDDQG